LNVLPDDLWLKVRRGKTIWEALQKTDVELESNCGGQGKCGKCKVKLLSSIGAPSPEARELLDEEELQQGVRLACRTKIRKDLTIYLGEADPDLEYFQILKSGYLPLMELDPLVDKRLVSIPSELRYAGVSDLDRIRLALSPDYQDLKASLHCLGTLPAMLRVTRYQGAAVLHDNYLMAWQYWEEGGRRYGLVFDLGTSTLVGKLISLEDGHEVAAISRINSQWRYGADVISRLNYAKTHPHGLDHLQRLLLKDLNGIIKRLLEVDGLERNELFVAVAAGNTTMQHFLLTLDPAGIAEAPFSPILRDGVVIRAADVGLELHPEARLYVLPAKAGYIGGDLVGVILASSAAEQGEETVLGLDLGTNGEIFLGNNRRMMTCSTAAGPALEGARISRGMIAQAGAIEGVSLGDGNLDYQVIGNIKPKGICGSGLVDLVAVLLHCGIIDHEGLIVVPEAGVADGLRVRVVDRSGVNAFLVASAEETYDGRPIYLTQRDVREVQLAKAAVAAGVRTLMDAMGLRIEDIDRVYLAGALGNYAKPLSAIRIGLIPGVDPTIVRSLGNAASTGAAMVLLSRAHWQKCNRLVEFLEHVELSSRLDFNDCFVEHMDFPTENMW
jgi:uncharacterized 2Fe-2S/4Fe-4S cluster protein (DUF4445 family)